MFIFFNVKEPHLFSTNGRWTRQLKCLMFSILFVNPQAISSSCVETSVLFLKKKKDFLNLLTTLVVFLYTLMFDCTHKKYFMLFPALRKHEVPRHSLYLSLLQNKLSICFKNNEKIQHKTKGNAVFVMVGLLKFFFFLPTFFFNPMVHCCSCNLWEPF